MMDISVEYPFIMFIVVFETVLILLLTSSPFNTEIYVVGLGTLPPSPDLSGNRFDWVIKLDDIFSYTVHIPKFIDILTSLSYYIIEIFIFFFKLLVLPDIPIAFRFISTIIFVPLTLVFAWIMIKTIIPLVQSIIGTIP